MALPLLTPFRGLQFSRVLQIVNFDGSNAINVFTSGSTLSASVWEGQSQSSIFAPTVSWYTAGSTQTGYDQGQVALSIAGSQTTGLDPAGEYFLLVSSTDSGLTSPVWEGRLKVLATPGSVSPAPPDLATLDYVESYLTVQQLTDGQRDFLPYLITANSNSVRRWCMDRNFDVRTYTQCFPVALDGTVRLYQVPVNQVQRVQGPPELALTISNGSQSIQNAQVYFSYTGEAGGYGANAETPTGINLVSVSSGVATTTNIAFADGQVINDVVALIGGVGGGWTATADPVLGLWPVTELTGGYLGQGAALSASPNSGASFTVLTDLNCCQMTDQQLGFMWVGRQYQGFGPRWGPGWDSWDSGTAQQLGTVKVTYSAGFTTIPPAIQKAVAEMCKDDLLRMRINPYLESESADEYSYKLRMILPQSMSSVVLQLLSPFRLHYA
jgi:hypothetical protein